MDNKGYLRFKDSDSLVHRWVAYHQIYNKSFFFFPFSYYIVHHKDKNKLNNNAWNLQILSQGRHRKEHNIPHPLVVFFKWLDGLIFGKK